MSFILQLKALLQIVIFLLFWRGRDIYYNSDFLGGEQVICPQFQC
jgi:hypothetical protein